MSAACRLLLLGVLLLGTACTPQPSQESPRPARRIVLISIDTLRADRLGAYGYDRPTSPVLDSLADDGARFLRCSATSPWTTPSHMSMLTGLYPSRHGVIDDRRQLREGVATLAEVFAAQGFRTGAVVASEMALPCERCRGSFEHYTELEWRKKLGEPGPVILNRAPEVNAAAFEWLRAVPADAPFFLFLHYYDVHNDYAPEPQFARLLGAGDDLEPGSTNYLIATRGGFEVPSDALEQMQRLYDAEIRQLDTRIGELFTELARLGLWDDSVIVVTADHGEEFREHGGFLHGRTLYEELLHVPLIMRGPGIPAGATVDALVSLVDIMPTLLTLAAVPVLPELDGRSLVPLFTGADVEWAEIAVSEADHYKRYRSIRAGRYKLIQARQGADQLYDLATDPNEQHNLAARESERRGRLAQRMSAVLAGQAPTQGQPLTAERRDRLRVLGYIDD